MFLVETGLRVRRSAQAQGQGAVGAQTQARRIVELPLLLEVSQGSCLVFSGAGRLFVVGGWPLRLGVPAPAVWPDPAITHRATRPWEALPARAPLALTCWPGPSAATGGSLWPSCCWLPRELDWASVWLDPEADGLATDPIGPSGRAGASGCPDGLRLRAGK